MRRCRHQHRDIGQVDLRGRRGAQKNDRKPGALTLQTHHICGRCDIGDAPTPRLLAERQLEAVAPQGAPINYRQMASIMLSEPSRLGHNPIGGQRVDFAETSSTVQSYPLRFRLPAKRLRIFPAYIGKNL